MRYGIRHLRREMQSEPSHTTDKVSNNIKYKGAEIQNIWEIY